MKNKNSRLYIQPVLPESPKELNSDGEGGIKTTFKLIGEVNDNVNNSAKDPCEVELGICDIGEVVEFDAQVARATSQVYLENQYKIPEYYVASQELNKENITKGIQEVSDKGFTFYKVRLLNKDEYIVLDGAVNDSELTYRGTSSGSFVKERRERFINEIKNLGFTIEESLEPNRYTYREYSSINHDIYGNSGLTVVRKIIDVIEVSLLTIKW